MKPLTILMIGWEYPPHISGGLGVACQGIAKSLAELGHKVIFLLPKLHGDEEQMENIQLMDINQSIALLSSPVLSTLKQMRAYKSLIQNPVHAYSGKIELDQSRYKITPYYSDDDTDLNFLDGGFDHTLFFQIECFREWAGMVAKNIEFDIVHAHDWMCFGAGAYVSENSQKAFIAHVHSTEFDRNPKNPNEGILTQEKTGLSRADAIICVSRFSANNLSSHYNISADKIHIVYNGIDQSEIRTMMVPDKIERNLGSDEFIVLFLGRMTFQKGPENFVRAAAKVIDKLAGVRFVMVGDGDMYQPIIDLVGSLGLDKHFHFTGFLNREDVVRAYRNSDLYVLPSVSEPFGISPLEAMLHGVPVIVSMQSGVSELISNCVKVNFWNSDEIADQIIRLLTDESLRNEFRRKGYEEVKQITWNKSIKKLLNVYEKFAN